MNPVLAKRLCFDCGATRAEAAFVGDRKPRLKRDLCVNCTNNPLSASRLRVEARKAELAALHDGRPYRHAKPIHTTPLFARLGPSRANTARASDGSRGPSQSPESPIINEDI